MKLFENFIDINNIVNIQIMKCYKILFSKEGIINNIAFYLIIPIILFHIISIFVFYLYQKREIFDKIKDIILAMINRHLITKYERQNKKIKHKNNHINENKFELIYENQKIIKNKKKLRKQKGKNIIHNEIIQNNIFIENNNVYNFLKNDTTLNEDNNQQNLGEKEKIKKIKLSSSLNLNPLTNKFYKKYSSLIHQKKS